MCAVAQWYTATALVAFEEGRGERERGGKATQVTAVCFVVDSLECARVFVAILPTDRWAIVLGIEAGLRSSPWRQCVWGENFEVKELTIPIGMDGWMTLTLGPPDRG